MLSLSLGPISISSVLEKDITLNPKTFFRGFTEAEFAPHRSWLAPHFLDASDMLLLHIQTYVVRTRHHTILVDTCFGNDKPRPTDRANMLKGPYLQDLQAAGVALDKVDYVLCTHLHVDHVGWNTRLLNGKWAPTFPKAKYLFAREEVDYWRNVKDNKLGSAVMEDSVTPVLEAGLAQLIDGEHEIEDGLRIVPLPGHTPGHVSLHLRAGGRHAIMTGDMMHSPAQCAMPHWDSSACLDREATQATRRAFLERYGDTDVLVMPAHFSPGHVVKAGKTWAFKASQ